MKWYISRERERHIDRKDYIFLKLSGTRERGTEKKGEKEAETERK